MCAAVDIHSLARPGALLFFLLRARRGKFTHSLARLRLCVVGTEGALFFVAPCAAGEIHSLTGASAAVCGWKSGRVFFFCSVRGGGKFTHSLAHPGARFFFLFCARRGKFTHSLARPRLCVVFFCCLRGGGNSLTHSRVRGRFFLFAVCAAVDIHSLTGASGGDSLTHWRVRGRVFFFLFRARWGKFTHSLARPRLCVVGTEGAFFFLLRARRAKQKKNTGRVFFFVRHAAGRAKKKLSFRARRAKKKTHLPIRVQLSNDSVARSEQVSQPPVIANAAFFRGKQWQGKCGKSAQRSKDPASNILWIGPTVCDLQVGKNAAWWLAWLPHLKP